LPISWVREVKVEDNSLVGTATLGRKSENSMHSW
jgi:hypothetical protein